MTDTTPNVLQGRVLVKTGDFRLHKNNFGYVLSMPGPSKQLVLNDAAALIWTLLDDGMTLAEIAAEIQCAFHADPERIIQDVAEAADQLVVHSAAAPMAGESGRGFSRKHLAIEEIDVVVINRAVDADRMSRASGQLDAAGLSYRRVEAVDKECLSEERVKTELTEEGYGIYRRHGSKPGFGSMTRGGLACALSWKSVLETRAASDSEYLLILEDDFVLCDSFTERFSELLSNLPADFDIIYLSWNHHGWPNAIQLDGYLDRLYGRIHGTGALLIDSRCIPEILAMFPLTLQLDHDLPDKLILGNRIKAFKGYHERSRIVRNDNLGGTTTQS